MHIQSLQMRNHGRRKRRNADRLRHLAVVLHKERSFQKTQKAVFTVLVGLRRSKITNVLQQRMKRCSITSSDVRFYMLTYLETVSSSYVVTYIPLVAIGVLDTQGGKLVGLNWPLE